MGMFYPQRLSRSGIVFDRETPSRATAKSGIAGFTLSAFQSFCLNSIELLFVDRYRSARE
jgi:hypothetical protein